MAPRKRFLLLLIAAAISGLAAGGDDSGNPPSKAYEEKETIDQPPARVSARSNLAARSPGLRVLTGPYVSVQVNVDALGRNIVGDAANETTIAVNPQNRNNIVIGWRQFDSVTSNFRQAGWAYTFDRGASWTFPGTLTPGIFRSDPSIDVNSSGEFFYQSLKSDFTVDVFKSTDGGITWGVPAPGFGGDKNWLAVDRTGGPTDGYIYGIWQHFVGCCGDNVLTRSVNGGQTFTYPIPVTFWPRNGTLAVGADGTVFAAGVDGTSFPSDVFSQVVSWPNFGVATNVPPADPGGTHIDLKGSQSVGTDGPKPNPEGLNGQINVAADLSTTSTRGNVYVLASVAPRSTALPSDPLDVHFIRSVDSGRHWSQVVRVNDDDDINFQWFGAHAVAPNGRIDAIWFDTRKFRIATASQLYYAYSWDAGATWSRNVAASPLFDSWAGFPNQNKIGDYMGLVSDATGADVAYPATFNGEEDIYYVRLFPDCNGNGLSDVTDIATHQSQDCNLSHIPDECETAPACVGAGRVPDGGLTVDKGEGGTIVLSWTASCSTADTDYAVYEGSLGDFVSHAPRVCSTGGAQTFDLTPASEDAYYLIVPVHADREGSYGADGSGAERPQGASACVAQAVHACGT